MTGKLMYSSHVLCWLGLALVATPALVRGQAGERPPVWSSAETFGATELSGDLEVARKALVEAHAGFNRYSSAAETEAAFQRAEQSLRDGMTELEFLGLIRDAVAVSRDGHTRVSPSRELASLVSESSYVLPLDLEMREDGAYVKKSYAGAGGPPPGARVLSINDDGMQDILTRLLAAHPGDGSIQTGKLHRLGRPLTFSDYYMSQLEPTERYDVRFQALDGGPEQRVALEGMTPAEFRMRSGAGRHGAPQATPPIEFTSRDGIGVLTVRSFGAPIYETAGLDFPEFLQRTFEQLRNTDAKGLVIDVRGNGGGTDRYGLLLASYLLSERFQYYERLEVKTASFPFLTSLGTGVPDIPMDQVRSNDRGNYDYLDHSNLGSHEPQGMRFGGPVVVLQDGGSFSATSEFLSVVRHADRAVFVGEESGGGYYGNTSGLGATVTLPATGVRVQIPIVGYWMAVPGQEPRDRGLIPDHRVDSSIEELLMGTDRPLEFARNLLSQG